MEAGIAAENADPYPRPPVPVFDLREVCERVENWQADVLSSPFPQVHSEDFELNQATQCSTHVGDAKQSPHKFSIVKQRRSNVAKVMKRKDSPSYKDHSTSRFFRGVTDPKFRGTDGVNRVIEAVATRPSEPCGSNVGHTLHPRAGALGEHPDTASNSSPISETAAGQQIIQHVSEVDLRYHRSSRLLTIDKPFLPPSFPSHLRTSTPPSFPMAKTAQARLSKPPGIPRNENLCFSASLPSPLPFPLSQAIDEKQGHESQPNDSPSLSRCKRPLPDGFTLEVSPSRLPKQWHQSTALNEPTPPGLSLGKPHDDIHRRARNVSSTLSPPEHLPVIDLRQLTQRSRAKSRHPSHGINPMTPRTNDKGKGRQMTVDISPSQSSSLSPPWTSRSLTRVPSPHFWTPPHSQTNFTQYADAFAHATASTQPPPAKGLVPRAESQAFALSPGSQVNA